MQKERQIQIPETLFLEICKYFLLEHNSPETKKSISRGLSQKLDRIVQHDLYTTYKTAASEEEKEKARREYLEKKGIPDKFRW